MGERTKNMMNLSTDETHEKCNGEKQTKKWKPWWTHQIMNRMRKQNMNKCEKKKKNIGNNAGKQGECWTIMAHAEIQLSFSSN